MELDFLFNALYNYNIHHKKDDDHYTNHINLQIRTSLYKFQLQKSYQKLW